MKTLFTLAAVLVLSSLGWGQQSTTTVHNGNTGTDTTIACDGVATPNATCAIYDSTPSLWQTMKQNRAQAKFCKAQHIPLFGKDHQRTPECERAWSEHLAKGAK